MIIANHLHHHHRHHIMNTMIIVELDQLELLEDVEVILSALINYLLVIVLNQFAMLHVTTHAMIYYWI